MEMREHKKETKCGFGGVSMYDQQGIEKKLADMARKGWLIEEMQNAFFWNYRRIEPKELHFAAVYAVLHHYGHKKCDNRLPRLKRSPVLAPCLLDHLVLLHGLSALG